jgi:protein TonB
MNHVSIFEKRWLELVFEGRNKNYGAYRLRLENERTTVFALFLSLLLITTAVVVPIALSRLFVAPAPIVEVPDEVITPLILSDIDPPKPDDAMPAVAPVKPVDPVDNGTPLNNPVVTKSSEAEQDVVPANTPVTQPETGSGAITGTNLTSGGGESLASATGGSGTGEGERPDVVETPLTVDKLPVYPGGMPGFYKYVARNFRQPELDESGNISVIVAFVIEKDGSLSNIRVARDPGYGMGAEAIRVLKSMKEKWEPGLIHGKPVRTALTLPITVRMK